MHRLVSFFFLFAVIGILIGCQKKDRKDSQFISLFNGKDLAGWYAQGGKIESWKWDEGMLSCIAPGGGWLTTEKEYGDFVLRLDWRLPKDGNSGVGLRYPSEGSPAHDGMEIQILDDDAEIHKDIKPTQHTGSIYYQVAAKQGVAKPVGEWNSYEITCQGPIVMVVLNGVEVARANMDECKTAEGDHKPLSQRPRRGHVGLQSHETRVDYRNVEIRVL